MIESAPPQMTFSHPTGNANVRQALTALSESNVSVDFHTTVGFHEGDIIHQLAGKLGGSDVRRRSYQKLAGQKLHAHPAREALRLLSNKLGIRSLTTHEHGFACVDQVYQDLDGRVASFIRKKIPRAVYAYEDGAVKSFKVAHELGVSAIYDLPIGYWRAGKQIQLEEAERLPEWAVTMPALINSDEKLQRKDLELQMADHIVVATSFTQKTLNHAPFKLPPVKVIPYGAPKLMPHTSEPPRKRQVGSPLKVLFVGSLGQRKGLAYLLDAVSQLGRSVTLTLIGQRPVQSCEPLDQALIKHRWIRSLPHSGILEEMEAHDVLVFPSLFEGFGLVILEAMSRGLPVITTPNTAGPDIINDGADGYIVPIRSAEAIRDKLELLRMDSDLLLTMSDAAKKTALSYSWESYRAHLGLWVRNCLSLA